MLTSRIVRASDRGFTLVELLTVVALVAVLAAMALQTFLGYRERAYDTRAMHDLANAVTAEEAYYAANMEYVSFSAVGPTVLAIPGMVVSDTVTLAMRAAGDAFSGTAVSSKGTGRVFAYDSLTDPLVND